MKDFLKLDYNLLQDKRLSISDKLVYAYIKSYRDAKMPFFSSNSDIAKRLGLSRRSVIRSIDLLAQKQLIIIEYAQKNGPSASDKSNHLGPNSNRLIYLRTDDIKRFNDLFKY